MKCDETLERLDAYALGDVPPFERVPLEAHLRDCSACRNEYAQRVLLLSQVRVALRHPLPVSRLAELRQQILQERTERQTALLVREGLNGIARHALAIAAMLTLVAWVGSGVEADLRSRTVSPDAIEQSIDTLVQSNPDETNVHGYLLGHRVSLERYLALAAGAPDVIRPTKPAQSVPEDRSETRDDRIGTKEMIESRWALHYSA